MNRCEVSDCRQRVCEFYFVLWTVVVFIGAGLLLYLSFPLGVALHEGPCYVVVGATLPKRCLLAYLGQLRLYSLCAPGLN